MKLRAYKREDSSTIWNLDMYRYGVGDLKIENEL
jgi:hypothetical protein